MSAASECASECGLTVRNETVRNEDVRNEYLVYIIYEGMPN